jgi:hypothetical protein
MHPTPSPKRTNTPSAQATNRVQTDIRSFVGIENKISMTYNFIHIDTKSNIESGKRNLRWEAANNIVAPGKTIHCQASAQSGTFDGEYTSMIKVCLNSGMEINL